MKNTKNQMYTLIFICALLILSVFLTYLNTFSGGFSHKSGDWGAFGSYFGGLISPILSFITIVVLLIYNHKQYDLMSKQYSIAIKPYVTFGKDIKYIFKASDTDPNQLAETTDFIQIRVDIQNIGSVPTKFQVDCNYEGTDNKVSHATVLFPNQTLHHSSKKFSISPVKPIDISGDVTFFLTYWAVDNHSIKYFFNRRMNIFNGGYVILNDEAGEI